MNQGVRSLRLSIPMVLASGLMLVAAETTSKSAQVTVVTDIRIDLANGISAREAVSLALRQNPGLLALRKAHEVAVAGVSRVKALSEPELRMGWTGLDNDWVSPRGHDYDVALRWSPPRPGERSLKGDWAMGKVSEADGEIAGAEQKVAAEILFLHTKIVFLDEQAATAEAAVKLREQIVDFVESQVKAELKTLLDQNVAELALADARSLPVNFRTERLLCMGRLIGELNLPPATELKIQIEGEPLTLRPRLLDVADLTNKALMNRSELAIASSRYSQAQTMLSFTGTSIRASALRAMDRHGFPILSPLIRSGCLPQPAELEA